MPAILQKAGGFRDGEFSRPQTRNREIAKLRKCEIAMKIWREIFYTPEEEVVGMKLIRDRECEIAKSRNREIAMKPPEEKTSG